jgi:hypothetical protein
MCCVEEPPLIGVHAYGFLLHLNCRFNMAMIRLPHCVEGPNGVRWHLEVYFLHVA